MVAMSPSQRMIAWGLSVSAGHVALGLVGWLALGVPGSLLFFGLCAALTLAVAIAAAPLLRPRRPPEDGGGGLPEPDGPPPWWPEFEREFRAHARRPHTRA